MKTYAVVCASASGSVFVKDFDFFVSQGGLRDAWGKRWRFIAATSVEHARRVGCQMFPAARPYERQRLARSRVPAPAPAPTDEADRWYAAELERLRERAPA